MTPSTQRINSEEAKKELLATIHAGRELGPEMDDALIDRYIEQLGKLRPAGSFDPATTRTRLQTLLNSTRGSDPVGDDAAAQSFLDGIQTPRAVAPAYGGYPANPNPQFGPLVRFNGGAQQLAPMLIMATIFIVALIVSKGELWWLFWVLPMAFGWGRRGRYRRLDRGQQRGYRNNRIMGADEMYRPLPPSGPPEVL